MYCSLSDANIRHFIQGHAGIRRATWFAHKLPSNRESLEPIALLNSSDTTDTMKAHGTWHKTESRQHKFDLNLGPDGRSPSREYKHSALAYIDAVPGAVIFHAIGPAKQDWQSYLEPPRIPSLD